MHFIQSLRSFRLPHESRPHSPTPPGTARPAWPAPPVPPSPESAWMSPTPVPYPMLPDYSTTTDYVKKFEDAARPNLNFGDVLEFADLRFPETVMREGVIPSRSVQNLETFDFGGVPDGVSNSNFGGDILMIDRLFSQIHKSLISDFSQSDKLDSSKKGTTRGQNLVCSTVYWKLEDVCIGTGEVLGQRQKYC